MEKRSILLVEDDLVLALVEKRQLEVYGYEVVQARSGEEAVDFMKNNPIDLILMDIDLGPGIDGTKAAELIQKEHTTPILFLSSHTEPAIVQKTESISSYGYVVKNSGITVLDAAIKMAFKLFDANQRLKETRDTLEATIKAMPDLLLEIDKSGLCYQYHLPEGVLTYFGSGELVGRNVFDILPHDLGDLLKDALEAADLKGHALSRHYKSHLSSRPEWFELAVNPHIVDSGLTKYIILRRNITERKIAEHESWLSGEKWKRLFEILPIGVTVRDHENKVIETNLSVNKILNSQANCIKNDGSPLKYDELPSVRAIAENRPITNVEVGIFQEDRSMIWTEISAIPLPNREGVVEVTRDITKVKENLLEISQSEERFRSLFDHLEKNFSLYELVFDSDSKPIDYRILVVNSAYARNLGKEKTEIIGKLGSELNSNIDPRWLDVVFSVAQTGKTQNFEDYQVQNGKYWEITCYSPKLGQFAVLARDVTEKKLSRDRLEKIQKGLNEAEETAKMGSWTWDPHANIVHWSRGMHLLFGIPEGSFSGSAEEAINYFHPDDREYLAAAAGNAFKGGGPRPVEARIILPDGSLKYVLGNGRMEVDTNGNLTRFSGTYQDITSQKLAENKIRGLLERNTILLKESHHRVRNFLTTIQGLLSFQAEFLHDPKTADILREVSGRLRNMGELFNRLYTTEDASSTDMAAFFPVFLQEVLSNFVNSDGLEFSHEITSLVIDGKKLQVMAIILNELITNSVKYAFAPKNIGKIFVRIEHESGKVRVTYSDDGRDPECITHIEQSRGFGSTLIDQLVEQLRGKIVYEYRNGLLVVIEFTPTDSW